MKNMIKVLVVALTSLAFTGVSFAQAKPATPTAPAAEKKSEMKSEKAKTTRITGEVMSVDSKTGMLTVKTKDKETKLTADAKAKDQLEKVKVGDTVRVSYSEKDGKMVATSIAKSSPKKSEATEKTSEKKSDMPEKKMEKK
jgi:DNA helicase TIP49 (TBP-interacting protein)